MNNRRVGSVVFYRLRDPRTMQLLFVAQELLVTSLQGHQELLQALGGPTKT